MNTTRRRRYQRPQRRRIIEDAALGIFAERGYPNARVEDIAAAAGVTKQLLHQHFPSKKSLYLAVLAKHHADLSRQLAHDLTAATPSPQRQVEALDRWVTYVETHPQAVTLLFRDTTGDPEIQVVYRAMQSGARAPIAASLARSNPGLPADHIEPLAELIRAGSTALALWWIQHPQIPRATILQLILDTYVRPEP